MISVVILTKNENKNIERCLSSVNFSDDIVVIDDNSTDSTVDLAEKYSVRIFKRDLNNDFAAQRNFGMEKVKNRWILFIDADEEVSPELAKELNKLDEASDVFYIRRRDFWWDKELKYGETFLARNLGIIRLVKKNSGVWVRPIHEEFETTGNTGSLKGFLNHYPHPSVKDFLSEVNYYSTVRARELLHNKKKTSIFQVVFFPFTKFLLGYFFRLGFLDGPQGFAYSFFMSFHSFLVRAKLYQYQTFHEKSA